MMRSRQASAPHSIRPFFFPALRLSVLVLGPGSIFGIHIQRNKGAAGSVGGVLEINQINEASLLLI